jgi:ATP-dependent Clp protease ATP-binding subunit ClpA
MRFDRFTLKAQEAVQEAQNLAGKWNQQEIAPEHLLYALLTQEGGVVPAILKKIGVEPARLADEMQRAAREAPKVTGAGAGQTFLSNALKHIFDQAFKEAEALKDDYVSCEHILIAIAEEKGCRASDALRAQGIVKKVILTVLQDIRGEHRVTDQDPEGKYQALKKYGRDLTEAARQGKLDPVIGRDEEIRRVIHVLSRRTKNNPVLIGEPGVGKTAIVEGLAQRIVSGDITEVLKDKRVVALDLAAMVAGAKYRGEFEDRLKAVLKEIQGAGGEIILFIDEMHTLMGAGGAEGAIDASNMLKPALARGELRAIGATTLNEYRNSTGTEGKIRDSPRGAHPGCGDYRGSHALVSLHCGPLPPRQGHRSHRRGGLEAADRNRFNACGDRHDRTRHHGAGDRVRGAQEGNRRGQQGAACGP